MVQWLVGLALHAPHQHMTAAGVALTQGGLPVRFCQMLAAVLQQQRQQSLKLLPTASGTAQQQLQLSLAALTV